MSATDDHYVYRCYDETDRLVYIGCARDVPTRFQLHHALVIKHARKVTTERYDTKVEARAAEREAIKAEAPPLNKEHNPSRFQRVQGGRYEAVEPIHPLTAELVEFDKPVTWEQMVDAADKLQAYMEAQGWPA